VICGECSTENRAGRKYCSRCGARLAVACPSCGAANLPGESFCGDCGAALGAEPGPPPGGEATPQTERRFVTVLFADLVGFTPLSESRDPEDVRAFLMGYFSSARETIERFGGTVDKFIGDAVMAVWGAVTAQEDDAERAVRAGLELAGSIPKLGSEIDLPDLAVRVGILTGEAAVGPGGNERGLVVGDLVNTASRLQSIAPPGTVLVGESTYRTTRRSIKYEALGDQALKGKQLSVPAWRATGVAGLRGGWQRRADVMEAPFVNRVEELRLLKDALHATGRERRARLVSIVGIAGIGKTRLAWEFEKYVDGITEPIYWHEGHSPAYGEGVALWALGEMVRRRAGIAEGEEPTAARERLMAMLDHYIPDARERRWMEPRLAGLLGLVDLPVGEIGELFSAFRTLFERVADLGTTVLVFEDLHLADAGLLDFIEGIAEWSRDHPILVVTLARPEILDRRPGWGAGRHSFLYVHLGPLSPEEMRQLVESLAPGAPRRVVERVLEAAAGVPLYAVELVRMLIDDGHLIEEDGRFRLAGDLHDLAVPESLHALIGARLDLLDPATRDLVGDAAVLGRTFTLEALAALNGPEPSTLRERLAELTRRELLEVHRDPESPERGQYGFVQSIIREVAYGRLAHAERRQRHLQAARYFEGLGGDEAAGIVAGHYLSAGAAAEGLEAEDLARRAAAALRAAAERAFALHSHQQALAYCRKALQAAPEDENTPIFLELAAESAAALVRPDEAEDFARRLVVWHLERQHRGAELRAVHLLGRILVERQEAGRAILLLEETLPLADEEEHPDELAALRAVLARAHMLAGGLPRAIATANDSLMVAERLGLIPVVAQDLITKGTALGDLGRRREGVALLQGALQLAIEHELPTTELRARMNLSHLTWDDDPVAQLANLRAGFEQARRLGNRGWAVMLVGNLFDVLRATGDFDGALAALDSLDPDGLPPQQRTSLQMVRMTVTRYREDPAVIRREVDRLAALTADSPDLQSRYYALVFRAVAAGLAGDHDAEFDLAEHARDENPMGSGEWLFPAGEAAIWMRHVRRLGKVRETLTARGSLGRMYRVWDLELAAAQDALEERAGEAVTGFEQARRRWEELGLKLHVAQNRIHLTLLCPDSPEAAPAADEARRLLEQMGAPNLLAQLDQAIGTAAPAGRAALPGNHS
jgi:class 3 adenylate cyclase/tetratricopeptide (TPR) repeat protein